MSQIIGEQVVFGGKGDRCLWYLYRRPNIYFNITSPTSGTFIIALHYKGREKAILEMDLNIDDLLEKVCSSNIVIYFVADVLSLY